MRRYLYEDNASSRRMLPYGYKRHPFSPSCDGGVGVFRASARKRARQASAREIDSQDTHPDLEHDGYDWMDDWYEPESYGDYRDPRDDYEPPVVVFRTIHHALLSSDA